MKDKLVVLALHVVDGHMIWSSLVMAGWIPVNSSDTTRVVGQGSGASDEFDEQLQEQEDMVQLRPIVGPTRGRGDRRYSAVHSFEVDL